MTAHNPAFRATLRVAIALALLALAGTIAGARDDDARVPDPAADEGPSASGATVAEPPEASEDEAVAAAPEPDEPDERVARGDRFLMAGTIVVPRGETRYGDVVAIGGSVRVEGRVHGSVIVVGGDAVVEGHVDRDVVAVLSDLELGPEARVDWSVVNVLGEVVDRGAAVGRDFVHVPLALSWPGVGGPFRILLTLWLWVKAVVLVLVFLGILVLAALAPDRIDRLADETDRRAGVALLLGAPTFLIGLPLAVLALVASLVGLLVLPVVLLALAFVVWLGYAGIFRHVGRRIGRAVGRELSLLGSLLLGFLLFALVWFIPLVGSIVWTGLTWLATGLVITGRLGSGSGRPGAPPAPGTAPATVPETPVSPGS